MKLLSENFEILAAQNSKERSSDSLKYRLSALVIVFSPDEGSGFLRNSSICIPNHLAPLRMAPVLLFVYRP